MLTNRQAKVAFLIVALQIQMVYLSPLTQTDPKTQLDEKYERRTPFEKLLERYEEILKIQQSPKFWESVLESQAGSNAPTRRYTHAAMIGCPVTMVIIAKIQGFLFLQVG